MTDQPVLQRLDERAIRDEFQQLVLDDLLGPLDGEDEEFSGENPIDRYPLGRLAPRGVLVEPGTQEELAGAGTNDLTEGDQEPAAPSTPSMNPSALGFTTRVAGATKALIVTAKWGRYERGPARREETAGRLPWQRYAMGGDVRVELAAGAIKPSSPDMDQPDIKVRGRVRQHDGDWLISLYLENTQSKPGDKRAAESWIFQVELSATGGGDDPVFLPRKEWTTSGDITDRREQARLAMSYRLTPEFAVGSGAAVRAEVSDNDPMRAKVIRTSTVPVYEIKATDVPSVERDEDLPELAAIELGMAELSVLADGPVDDLRAALTPLVSGYRAWIERQEKRVADPAAHLTAYAKPAAEVLAGARHTASRIQAGIELLAENDDARRAFGFANQAMHLQRLHTRVAALRRENSTMTLSEALAEAEKRETPSWRPFQLAFVLLNLPSLANSGHAERSDDDRQAVADLLWFPTGGGKTEAYLGLTAFTIAVRRLQPGQSGMDSSAGMAVLMRYTLRLLTIQQFERATTLICAAESLRHADPATWGTTPFRIGLWVGVRVTPNTFDAVLEWAKEIRRGRGRSGARGQGSPHQLTSCPWCGERIEPGRDIETYPTYRRTVVLCPNAECEFNLAAAPDPFDIQDRGLPILVVDEEIYRHPPSLLIATVDKFAQLAWRGEIKALFGHVTERCERHGYVTDDLLAKEWETDRHKPAADAPAARIVGCSPLRPPDLIIQDELHLISGPLGSLVGLYETAVDKLATWKDTENGRYVRPKVVASTATVRRANHQIEALFRRQTEVFPPQGLDADDNYFARRRDPDAKPGRRYVGICAHGTRIRSTLIRVYVSVLGAAQKVHERYGANRVTDPYMTLVGYFNSLRDLGSMRRLVEDDVSARLLRATERGLAVRYEPDVEELTSRLTSDQIRPLLDRLAVPFPRDKGGTRPIDVLLATNMIAVGVDVSRLGLMVVTNQPKSTAEYIQATSRVGREKPGLVFTVYNWARPRDLSHYEAFEHFHATIYRKVEALSVTPFADRAIDRGLTGVLVSLMRQSPGGYNGNTKAQQFTPNSELGDHVVRYLRRRVGDGAEGRRTGQRVERELDDRLEYWDIQRLMEGRRLAYEQPTHSTDTAGLLRRPGAGPWNLATCPTSLREVEPGVQLLLEPLPPYTGAEPPFLPVAAEAETERDDDPR